MTGSRIALRRYSNCNMHLRSPLLPGDRGRRLYDPPPWYNRYKLYTLAQYDSRGSSRYHRDKDGVFVYMGTDCGWEWLATRPGFYGTWLGVPFNALHDHVHTPHRKDRMNVALTLQRMFVRATQSRELDERLATGVYPDAHLYRVEVRLYRSLTDDEQTKLLSVTDITIATATNRRSAGTTIVWYERASNSTHARERAQDLFQALDIPLGGTTWSTPIRVQEEDAA